MCHSCGGGRKKSVFFSVFLLWLVTIMGDRNWFFWKKCQFRLAHLLLGEKVSGEKTKLTKQPLPSPPTTNVAKNNHDMFCWYLEKTHVSKQSSGILFPIPKVWCPIFLGWKSVSKFSFWMKHQVFQSSPKTLSKSRILSSGHSCLYMFLGSTKIGPRHLQTTDVR